MSRFVRADRGATVIEYALIAAFISIMIVAATTLIGQKVLAMFQSAGNAFPS